jgi:hypothetical protein
MQDTELIVPEGAEVNAELSTPIDSDVCIGLVFTPDQLKEARKVK